MKYIAEIWQTGACDYSIECGTDVVNLKSDNMAAAEEELLQKIKEDYSSEGRELEGARIYAISEEKEVNFDSLYEQIHKEREMERRKKEYDWAKHEYERLKAKLNL